MAGVVVWLAEFHHGGVAEAAAQGGQEDVVAGGIVEIVREVVGCEDAG